MREKAYELNKMFNTNYWRPRDIDMILWTIRNDTVKREKKQNVSICIDRYALKDSNNNNGSFDFIEELKDEFANYLRSQGRKEEQIKEDCSWAFTHYRIILESF